VYGWTQPGGRPSTVYTASSLGAILHLLKWVRGCARPKSIALSSNRAVHKVRRARSLNGRKPHFRQIIARGRALENGLRRSIRCQRHARGGRGANMVGAIRRLKVILRARSLHRGSRHGNGGDIMADSAQCLYGHTSVCDMNERNERIETDLARTPSGEQARVLRHRSRVKIAKS